jgi:hypothetical protein
LRKLWLAFLLIASVAWGAERITAIHTVVNVTTASTSVLGTTRGIRSLLILQNDSDTTIYCNLTGGVAVVDEGIRLNAAGGTLFMDTVVPTVPVTCIHGGTGTKALLVTEG